MLALWADSLAHRQDSTQVVVPRPGSTKEADTPQYLYQVAYTAESLAAQIKKPEDRLEVVAKVLAEAAGAKILGGGYSFGEYDVSVVVEAADDVTASIALAGAAGGAVRAAKTTPLLSGPQWVAALKKAPAVGAKYRPAR